MSQVRIIRETIFLILLWSSGINNCDLVYDSL